MGIRSQAICRRVIDDEKNKGSDFEVFPGIPVVWSTSFRNFLVSPENVLA